MCDQRKTAKPGPIQQPAFWCEECRAFICGQESLKKHNEMCHKGDRDDELEEESSENLCSGEGKEEDDDEHVLMVVNDELSVLLEQVKKILDAKGIQPPSKKCAVESKSRPRTFEGPLNEKAGTSASVFVGRESTSSSRTGLSEATVKIESPEEDILPGPTTDVEDDDVVKITYYDCKLCGRAFRQVQVLRIHLVSVHGIDPSLLDHLLDVVGGKRIDRQKPSEEEHELDRKRRRKSPSVEIEYVGTFQPATAEGTNRSSTQAKPSRHVTSLSHNAGGKPLKSEVRTMYLPRKVGRPKTISSGRVKCDECPAAFQRPANLEDHKAAVHRGEGLYTCPRPRCGYQYFCRYVMRLHMKRSHGLVDVPFKRAANR